MQSWISTACLAIAGFCLAHVRPQWFDRALRSGVALLLATIALESAIGIARFQSDNEVFPLIHRWTGQAMVILAWTLPLWILCGLTKRRPYRRPKLALVALVLASLLVLLASMTGYLNALSQGSEETRNRFLVLHCGVLPILSALGTVMGLNWLRDATGKSQSD